MYSSKVLSFSRAALSASVLLLAPALNAQTTAPPATANATSTAATPTATAPTTTPTAPADCRCEERLGRSGSRVGVGLLLGGGLRNGGSSDGGFHLAANLRFGGAFTDRFHLLGEFTLGGIIGGPGTSFYGALDLQAQGFIGPNFYIRGGIGVAELVGFQGGGFFYSMPGPRLVGGVGYDLYRVGERSLALEFNTSYAFLNAGGSSPYDRLFLASLGLNFDFY